jgi:hypothetical protein
MVDETWKSSYPFDYRQAAVIMEEVIKDVGIPFARSTDDDADYFDIDGGNFTIKLYHNRFRMRTGFGFPGWLKTKDISDIMISLLDTSKEPKVRLILQKFVERAPLKPWEFGTKVKAYSLGISGRTKKSWNYWTGM